ncbi:PBECR4 domain-containing protein [Robertmurraya korlensis]|uniref:PBECR4 domain-containing protein n=1 Tax=Robertmurraya korlensis TaxID=519977 RepID=UPI00203FA3AB|nr:PBECR4 domain-containing protein [Robertmurraya korlensis]MCM3603194.1 PBECR4 domain-containing protein [Robertmurraya korlensis]
MLSTTDLLTISAKPALKDISLQMIQLFYKEHLCDRLFTFELDDPNRPFVKLRFNEKHLCHMLGIQYVVQRLKNKHDYSGEKGYKCLENGTLTFDFLKKTNKQWFNSKKNRMLYFPFVYQIVNNPTVIIFSDQGLNTSLSLDIILYNQLNNTFLHLGLDKDPNSDFYYPKTFYDRNDNKHIDQRTQLTVKNITVDID